MNFAYLLVGHFIIFDVLEKRSPMLKSFSVRFKHNTSKMASDGEQFETLRFQPWNSAPDVTFWQKLATLKLNTFQLNDQAQVRCLRCSCCV